jgi:hypothetical protein
MNGGHHMISLKERIKFVQDKLASLSSTNEMSFADRIMFNNMDSYLSDLKAEQRAIDSRHPLQDFMELRLKGSLVDFGTIPLEILSVISSGLAGMIQKATHRIASGKDSKRVPSEIKNSLNMRLADLTPGSTKLAITFSTGSCELVETVSSRAVKEIFSLLEAADDETFMTKIGEIGSSSAHSIKKIAEECEKNSLNFDISWVGPFSDGRRSVSLNSEKIHNLATRLALTNVSKPWEEMISGELALLSMYGKLEIMTENGSVKASYPIDMLDQIQGRYKVGQRVTMLATVTEVHNDRLNIIRQNYMIKSIQ